MIVIKLINEIDNGSERYQKCKKKRVFQYNLSMIILLFKLN